MYNHTVNIQQAVTQERNAAVVRLIVFDTTFLTHSVHMLRLIVRF